MTTVETYSFWDHIIDHYFDHVWPSETGMPSIINWVESEYNCKMDGNTATFANPADATLFQLRWNW